MLLRRHASRFPREDLPPLPVTIGALNGRSLHKYHAVIQEVVSKNYGKLGSVPPFKARFTLC